MKKLFNVDVDLDYNVYEDVNVGDDQDIVLNDIRLEIKSSAKGSQWLLVDDGIINRKRNLDLEPHHYIFCLVELDKNELGTDDCVVEIKGYATREELAVALHKNMGEFLPRTTTRLQAPNYCIHVDQLHNVDKLIREIL